jgi:type II secretory pathway pseudopilin PulG
MKRRAGWLLLELVVSVALLGVLAAAALHLLVAADRAAAKHAEGAGWVALAMVALSEDIREAAAVRCAGAQAVLQPASGPLVAWRTEKAGLVRYVGGRRDLLLPGVAATFRPAKTSGAAEVELWARGGTMKTRMLVAPRNRPAARGRAP